MSNPTISNDQALSEFITISKRLTGVQLSDRHRSMMVARLQKRMTEVGVKALSEYLTYYKDNEATERTKLISLVTTHHTFFFREFTHFEYLASEALPALIPLVKKRGDKKIRVWAAACSRGQEVYSLAMFLDFHLKRLDPSISFEIMGSDIDEESVAIATNGVYHRQELKEAPLALLADHWVKGTGNISDYAKVKQSLRSHCSFQKKNLLELKAEPHASKYDLIFCRNVFIYFNAEQISSISKSLLSRLETHGYYFVGISETLTGLKLGLHNLGPSVYRLESKAAPTIVAQAQAIMQSKVQAKPIRVLCVDDSSSIQTLLKQILTLGHGFEIVGTALNGIEAAKKVAELKPDVMTLDIHMPEQNGIEYLQTNFRAGHPPVVMITSVSREDSVLAGQALLLGAQDYVEKPALTNLADRGDEIRAKVKCVVGSKSLAKSILASETSFQAKRFLSKLDDKLRICAFSLGQRKNLVATLKEFSGAQPPCVLLMEGAKEVMPEIAKILSRESGLSIVHHDQAPNSLTSGQIILMDLGSSVESLSQSIAKDRTISMLVYGDISTKGARHLERFKRGQLVLEDLGEGKAAQALSHLADDIVLSTSFAYLSQEYFYATEQKAKKVA